MYRLWGKRLLDLSIALLVLIIFLPLLGVIALWVRLGSPGPALFVQQRLGWGGKIFRAYKFRTMTDQPRIPSKEIVGPNSEVTVIGYWLRRFKLDELPQLFNVVKGEMSIVGPRPALPVQLSEYDEVARKRLNVRPGLTGLAQVNGNIYLTWQQRWQYDVRYVDNLSLWLDLSIIFRTIAVMALGEERFEKQPTSSRDKG